MDTSTHVITGVGLAGLSFLDPTIASHPELLTSMLFCTIVGSNAPDVDFLYKYIGNDLYVQKHRGFSHSLFAQGFLAVVIASIATLSNGGFYFTTFFIWTLLAVLIHVLFDICNIYGTQAFRPLSNRWYALNILPIFDPFIMLLYIIGIIFWILGFSPAVTFTIIFTTIVIYIGIRYVVHYMVLKQLIQQSEPTVKFTLIPTFRLNHWGVIASNNHQYKLGKYENNLVSWSKVLMKASEKNQIIGASRKNDFVQFLMLHSAYLHAKIIAQNDGYEVHWFDLRYQSKIDEPFIAIIKLDKKLNLVASDVKRGLISAPERA